MSSIERRTLDELIARYELEPQLRDVYVEGPSDLVFFDWFFHAMGLLDVSIFEIADVEVPLSVIEDHGLTRGKRSEVIALALELQNALSPPRNQATCVADQDYAPVGDYPSTCEILFLTDFTSLELYFFDERVFDKFLSLFIGGFPITASDLLNRLAAVLERIFAIRVANSRLGLGLEWLSFTRCCETKEYQIVFDDIDFIRRYLNKGALLSELERFMNTVGAIHGTLGTDRRERIHGHDFISLLCWLIGKTRSSKRGLSDEIVRGALFTSGEVNWLMEYPLFQNLVRRLGN
jgi:hypothetical protein